MRLNTLSPAVGATSARKRVGRGQGSGTGGTAGRGHKGQKSRSGGYHKVGFEGGQMPLQRRLPKRGFRSNAKKHFAELRLNELAKVEGDVVDIKSLQKAGVIGLHIMQAKAILSGKIERAITLRGIVASAGARKAIEQAGGKVEDAGAISDYAKSGTNKAQRVAQSDAKQSGEKSAVASETGTEAGANSPKAEAAPDAKTTNKQTKAATTKKSAAKKVESA